MHCLPSGHAQPFNWKHIFSSLQPQSGQSEQFSLSNHESGELFADKGFEDFSLQDMLVIPVSELVSAQSQMLSNSVPEIQAIPTSQCSRPQLYAAHKIRLAINAGQSIGETPAAKRPSASDSGLH